MRFRRPGHPRRFAEDEPHPHDIPLSPGEVESSDEPWSGTRETAEDFHRAIGNNPRDLLRHQVYADWLAENGHDAAGEFIQHHVAQHLNGTTPTPPVISEHGFLGSRPLRVRVGGPTMIMGMRPNLWDLTMRHSAPALGEGKELLYIARLPPSDAVDMVNRLRKQGVNFQHDHDSDALAHNVGRDFEPIEDQDWHRLIGRNRRNQQHPRNYINWLHDQGRTGLAAVVHGHLTQRRSHDHMIDQSGTIVTNHWNPYPGQSGFSATLVHQDPGIRHIGVTYTPHGTGPQMRWWVRHGPEVPLESTQALAAQLVKEGMRVDRHVRDQADQHNQPEQLQRRRPRRFQHYTLGAPKAEKNHLGETLYRHQFHDATGKPMGSVSVVPRGDELHIQWAGFHHYTTSPESVANQLGPREVLHLGQQLGSHYPEATHFTYRRITGTRAGQPGFQQHMRLPIRRKMSRPRRFARRDFAGLVGYLRDNPDNLGGKAALADFLQEQGHHAAAFVVNKSVESPSGQGEGTISSRLGVNRDTISAPLRMPFHAGVPGHDGSFRMTLGFAHHNQSSPENPLFCAGVGLNAQEAPTAEPHAAHETDFEAKIYAKLTGEEARHYASLLDAEKQRMPLRMEDFGKRHKRPDLHKWLDAHGLLPRHRPPPQPRRPRQPPPAQMQRQRFAKKDLRPQGFIDALRHLRSSHQKKREQVAGEVAQSLALGPLHTRSALHDISGGRAFPGVAVAAYRSPDPETMKYAGAWMGLLTQTPSQVVFHVRKSGPDSVLKWHMRGSGDDIRNKLDRSGVYSRVLMPHGDGFHIMVFDQGRRLRPRMTEFARTHGITFEESMGKGEVIGGATHTEARDKYRKVIEKYEGGPVNAPEEQPQQMARRGRPRRFALANPQDVHQVITSVFAPYDEARGPEATAASDPSNEHIPGIGQRAMILADRLQELGDPRHHLLRRHGESIDDPTIREIGQRPSGVRLRAGQDVIHDFFAGGLAAEHDHGPLGHQLYARPYYDPTGNLHHIEAAWSMGVIPGMNRPVTVWSHWRPDEFRQILPDFQEDMPAFVQRLHQVVGRGDPEQMARRGRPVRFGRGDHRGFHAAIHANPQHKLNHLVYADWLEENGKPEVANHIRQAVEANEATIQVGWIGGHGYMSAAVEPGRRLEPDSPEFSRLRIRSLADPRTSIWYRVPHRNFDEASATNQRLWNSGEIGHENDPVNMRRGRPVRFSNGHATPVHPDLIAHAAHIFANPGNDAAMHSFADHVAELHPDHPFAASLPAFLQSKDDTLADQLVGKTLYWGSDSPHASVNLHPDFVHAPSDVTYQGRLPSIYNRYYVWIGDRGLPLFHRQSDGTWIRTDYTPYTRQSTTRAYARPKVRPSTPQEVSQEMGRHGLSNLVHAVIGAWYFAGGGQHRRMTRRGPRRRYADQWDEPLQPMPELHGPPRPPRDPGPDPAELAFHTAIHQDRENMVPHLVYADYLREQGHHAKADLIAQAVDEQQRTQRRQARGNRPYHVRIEGEHGAPGWELAEATDYDEQAQRPRKGLILSRRSPNDPGHEVWWMIHRGNENYMRDLARRILDEGPIHAYGGDHFWGLARPEHRLTDEERHPDREPEPEDFARRKRRRRRHRTVRGLDGYEGNFSDSADLSRRKDNVHHFTIAAAMSDPLRYRKTIKKSQVGSKIKKLRAEGKPLTQAQAIALNMSGQSRKDKKS